MKIPHRSKEVRIQRRNRELKELKVLQEQVDSFVHAYDTCMLTEGREKRSRVVYRPTPFTTV